MTRRIRTDLIIDDCVPGVLCKFAHRMCVCIILLVSNCTGTLQNGLELVLDFFKSPVIELTRTHWLAIRRQNALVKDRVSSGFASALDGTAPLHSEPTQPCKGRLDFSLYTRRLLLMC